MVEEPVDQDDYDGYKKISQKSSIPIAAGENEMTRFGFRDLLRTKAVDILNPDATCMGGVTEFLKIAGMADANGVVLSPHGQQQVHIHLDCAVPNATIAEFYHRNMMKKSMKHLRHQYALMMMDSKSFSGIGCWIGY